MELRIIQPNNDKIVRKEQMETEEKLIRIANDSNDSNVVN